MVMHKFNLTAGTSSAIQDQNTIIITAVVSSIIVVILSSTLFFFIGCVCGWVGHKHKQSAKANISQPAPVYEDLQPTSMPENQEKAFELEENFAYGPVRSM